MGQQMKIQSAPKKEIEIKSVQWFDDRYYLINFVDDSGVLQEKFVASVTTKLGVVAKPYIARWRGDISNREADLRLFEASEKGKRLHAAWFTFSTGGKVIYNPWDRPIFTPDQIKKESEKRDGNVFVIQYQEEMLHLVKLHKWVSLVKPTFLYSEKTLYSLKTNDAGTADSIVRIPGGVYSVNGSTPLAIPAGDYILDLKTGAQVDDNAHLQTAAYAFCYEEMGLGEIQGTIILHTQAKVRKGIEGLATLVNMRPEMAEAYKEYRLVAELWERRNKEASPKVFEFPATLSLDNLAA